MRGKLKSKRNLSSVMLEPFWFTSSPHTFLRAACSRWVAVCSLVVSSLWSASPQANFCSLPARDFSWCSAYAFL